MIDKVTIFLGILALTKAAAITPLFTPASSLPSALYPIPNPPNYKAKATPAPIYEENTEADYTDNTGPNSLRFINTIYPNLKNYHEHINNNARLNHNIQSNFGQSGGASIPYNPTYTLSSSPVTKSISRPVIYTTHTHSTPFQEIAQLNPLTTKTVPTYNTYAPITHNEAIKTAITYAESPAVSHVSFTGLGATYRW